STQARGGGDVTRQEPCFLCGGLFGRPPAGMVLAGVAGPGGTRPPAERRGGKSNDVNEPIAFSAEASIARGGSTSSRKVGRHGVGGGLRHRRHRQRSSRPLQPHDDDG